MAIILPTCNRFALLKRTLRSLEQQTYKDFTVYVSDDVSTDETKDHDAASFPNLKIHWVKRTAKFPGIAEHFSALYAEATEDWITLAHDDEVYAPEWLETLVGLMQQPTPDGLPIVMAQVGTVVVDTRFGDPKYFKRRDQIPDGLYTGNDLKRICLFDGRHFATNGYMVAREAAQKTGPFNPDYEQFDYEWLMRLAQCGRTACSTRLLHTYCMHPQNTVGSVRYLRRYFEQKNSSAMELEWLETLEEVEETARELRHQQLVDNIGRSQFRAFLKATAEGDRQLCLEIANKFRDNEFSSWTERLIIKTLVMPVSHCMARLALKAALTMRLHVTHASLIEIKEISWK